MSHSVQEKWIRIISSHCNLYYPSIRAINDLYKINIELIIDKGLSSEEKVSSFYLCPLCLKNFIYIKEGSIFENEDFDLDHFPPKSIGGKSTILVCKKCNSTYGEEFDYSIKDYLQFISFMKKNINANYTAKLSVENVEGNYKSNVFWNNDVLVHELDSFNKYPLLLSGFGKNALSGKEFSIKMRITYPHESLIHKAFLKAAYLSFFSYWGYEFAYSHAGRNIIKALNNEIEYPLSNFGVFQDESINSLNEGLYFIESPENYQSFMYRCKSRIKDTGENSATFVLIPKFGRTNWEQFKNLQSLVPNGEAEFVIYKLLGNGLVNNKHLGYSQTSKLFSKVGLNSK